MFVSVGAYVPGYACGGKRTIFISWFCPSTVSLESCNASVCNH